MSGLARAQPFTAMMLLVAGFALVGLPPFALFNSEILLVSALATQSFASDTLHVGQFVTITIDDTVRSVAMVTLLLVFAVVVFGGVTYRLVGMVWGTPPDRVERGERWDIGHVPLVVTALALAGLGITMPDQLRAMLDQAARVVLGK